MCEQHIDRKCTKCGWGLPLLERKRLRDWKRQQQLRATGRGLNEWSPNLTPMPEDGSTALIKALALNGSTKRDADSFTSDGSSSPELKRRRTDDAVATLARTRPWKDVFMDRFKVGTNWKYGRCSTRTFRGHTNGVMCLQFDDNILATGSYDATIKIWNIDTGECIRTLGGANGHTSGIRTLQFDDTKLISGSLDRTLKVWNWRTGECISTLSGHAEGVIALNFEGNILASGSIDKTVRIWNFQDKSTCILSGHKDWVNAVRVDSASRTVFSASDDCTVRLWDLDTKKTIRIFEGHVGQVQQVILLSQGYEPEDIDAEDFDDGSSNSSFDRNATPIPPSTSTFENWPAGRDRPAPYMLTAGLDSTIRLWDVSTGRCIKTLFGHVEGVWAIASDTFRVVSGAEDRMVKVWDARTGKCRRTFTGHAGPVTCVGLSDYMMVTGSEDCEVRLYSFKNEGGNDPYQVEGESANTSALS
jgi:F-box and WD-40 domain protein MET30